MLLPIKSRITGAILIFCSIASLVVAAIHQPYNLQSGFLILIGVYMGICGLRTFAPRNGRNVPK